jgi:hypothetical protein
VADDSGRLRPFALTSKHEPEVTFWQNSSTAPCKSHSPAPTVDKHDSIRANMNKRNSWYPSVLC